MLFLSFLLGLEREGRKAHAGHYIFGGVRTFPLIGLARLHDGAASRATSCCPWRWDFVVVGAFLLVSYLHKLASAEDAGVTTEISGLVTYMLGALVFYGYYWIAVTVVVLSMLLLELKTALEGLSERIPSEDVITFTKFLLLTVVILPAVPNQEFTPLPPQPVQDLADRRGGERHLLRQLRPPAGHPEEAAGSFWPRCSEVPTPRP